MKKSERRDVALSRERIVDAAVALLDHDGAAGLTFRALAERLDTGAGALYWHVANKTELLIAATDEIVARAIARAGFGTPPRDAIRRLAGSIFDAVDVHPWVGAQLSHSPWPAATMLIFERVGRQVQALGARGNAQFTGASALVSYIIGVSVQNAAQGRTLSASRSRAEFLASESERWKQLDASEYPFTRSIAARLRKHDDRAEFLAGIDLIIAGIAADAD